MKKNKKENLPTRIFTNPYYYLSFLILILIDLVVGYLTKKTNFNVSDVVTLIIAIVIGLLVWAIPFGFYISIREKYSFWWVLLIVLVIFVIIIPNIVGLIIGMIVAYLLGLIIKKFKSK